MYGNQKLPGVNVSSEYRSESSIWQGSPSSTWFKTVKVDNSDIKAGTIMKELTDGTYTPISESDMVSSVENLPGVRLAIVADKSTSSTVLVGICGQVDMEKLLIGEKYFSELTEAQRINLNLQLEAWGFMLVSVQQS